MTVTDKERTSRLRSRSRRYWRPTSRSPPPCGTGPRATSSIANPGLDPHLLGRTCQYFQTVPMNRHHRRCFPHLIKLPTGFLLRSSAFSYQKPLVECIYKTCSCTPTMAYSGLDPSCSQNFWGQQSRIRLCLSQTSCYLQSLISSTSPCPHMSIFWYWAQVPDILLL